MRDRDKAYYVYLYTLLRVTGEDKGKKEKVLVVWRQVRVNTGE